jgi:carbonic anhydrase
VLGASSYTYAEATRDQQLEAWIQAHIHALEFFGGEASDGKVAGVAVLLKAGRANATIQQIWDHMPKTEGKVLSDFSHAEEEIPGVEINPAGLLPTPPPITRTSVR